MKYSLPLVMVILFGLSGCTTYKAQPLNPEELWKSIESVTIDELLVQDEDAQTSEGLELESAQEPLSTEQVVSLAVSSNPELKVARFEKGIAEAQLVQAGILPNPEFEIRILDAIEGGGVTSEVNSFFSISEGLLLRAVKKRQAQAALTKIHWEIAEKEWELAQTVQRTLIEIQYLRQSRQINDEQLRVGEELLDYINKSRNLGAASNLDVFLIESDIFDVQVEIKRLDREFEQKLYDLNKLIGLPPSYKFPFEQNKLSFDAVDSKLESLLQIMRVCHPAIHAVLEEYQEKEASLELSSKRRWLPSLGLGPSIEGEGSNSSVGGSLSLELPIFDQEQGEIKGKSAAREQARERYIKALQEKRSELFSSWSRYERLRDAIKFYQSTVIPKVERSAAALKTAYQAGEVDLVNLILQQNKVIETKRRLTGELRDYAVTRIDILDARGPLCSQ